MVGVTSTNPDAPAGIPDAVIALLGWSAGILGVVCVVSLAAFWVRYRRGAFGPVTRRLRWVSIITGAAVVLTGSGWSLLHP